MLSVFVSFGGIPPLDVEAEHDNSLFPLATVVGLSNVAGLAALVCLKFLESLAFVATACWPWLEFVLWTALQSLSFVPVDKQILQV